MILRCERDQCEQLCVTSVQCIMGNVVLGDIQQLV